jgi:hypothetical protein
MKITPFRLGVLSVPVYFFIPFVIFDLLAWYGSGQDAFGYMLAFAVVTGLWIFLVPWLLLCILAGCLTGLLYSWRLKRRARLN